MIRTNRGLADWDLAFARFGATHATPASTTFLRDVSLLAGYPGIVTIGLVLVLVEWRRVRSVAMVAFVVLALGGQFAIAELVKALVGRERPDILHLTGFSAGFEKRMLWMRRGGSGSRALAHRASAGFDERQRVRGALVDRQADGGLVRGWITHDDGHVVVVEVEGGRGPEGAVPRSHAPVAVHSDLQPARAHGVTVSVSRPECSRVPGREPVSSPSATTATPLTSTRSTPVDPA